MYSNHNHNNGHTRVWFKNNLLPCITVLNDRVKGVEDVSSLCHLIFNLLHVTCYVLRRFSSSLITCNSIPHIHTYLYDFTLSTNLSQSSFRVCVPEGTIHRGLIYLTQPLQISSSQLVSFISLLVCHSNFFFIFVIVIITNVCVKKIGNFFYQI